MMMMKTGDVVKLTEKAVSKMLRSREAARPKKGPAGKRISPRWPFPGVVELWLPDEDGVMQHSLATSVNLSLHGIGIRFGVNPWSEELMMPSCGCILFRQNNFQAKRFDSPPW